MRIGDVDRSVDVWIFTPESHKTAHLGPHRVIFIGPKAQAILQRQRSQYLSNDGASPLYPTGFDWLTLRKLTEFPRAVYLRTCVRSAFILAPNDEALD
jgi:hypothetical protein